VTPWIYENTKCLYAISSVNEALQRRWNYRVWSCRLGTWKRHHYKRSYCHFRMEGRLFTGWSRPSWGRYNIPRDYSHSSNRNHDNCSQVSLQTSLTAASHVQRIESNQLVNFLPFCFVSIAKFLKLIYQNCNWMSQRGI
jgi:hypothetical protein